MDRMKKYQCILAEMAFTRDQIVGEIMSSDRVRGQHLILCFLFPKNSAVKHWQTEIQADLLDIAERKWKSNKKFLSQKEYFGYLWNNPYENADDYEIINKWIERLPKSYGVKSNWILQKKEIVKAIKSFYHEISILLAEGKLTKIDVYNLIEKYIIKK